MDGKSTRLSTLGRSFCASNIPLLGAAISTMLVLGSAQSGFISIDCGLTGPNYTDSNGIYWVSDKGFIRTGENANVPNPYGNLTKTQETVRYFPESVSKNCYELPATKNQSYLIRTTFLYANYDGVNTSPLFFLIIDSTLWTPIVADDILEFELILEATNSHINVCVARYLKTFGLPFISSLELRPLNANMSYAHAFDIGHSLIPTYRSNLGPNNTDSIRYPHDMFDRVWSPYLSDNSIQTSHKIGDKTYDQPPSLVTQSAVTDETITGFVNLNANFSYHIVFYCAEIGNASLPGQRVFDIYINGYENGDIPWYPGIDIVKYVKRSYQALEIFTISPISPPIDNFTFTFKPSQNSTYGPMMGGIEILRHFELSALTNADDVAALVKVQKDFNLTLWSGDPCLPSDYGWSWVSCDTETEPRITGISLSGYNLSGPISPNINLLTALTEIYLDHNALTGVIPNLSSLVRLTTVDLQFNNLEGHIPDYFADFPSLTELLMQSNDLNGTVPAALLTKAESGSFDFRYGGNVDLYCGSTLCSSVSPSQGNSSQKQPSPSLGPSSSILITPRTTNEAKSTIQCCSMKYALILILIILTSLYY